MCVVARRRFGCMLVWRSHLVDRESRRSALRAGFCAPPSRVLVCPGGPCRVSEGDVLYGVHIILMQRLERLVWISSQLIVPCFRCVLQETRSGFWCQGRRDAQRWRDGLAGSLLSQEVDGAFSVFFALCPLSVEGR